MGTIVLQLLTIFILTVLSLALWAQSFTDKRRLGFLFFSFFFALWIGIGIVANIDSNLVLFLNRSVFVIPLWIVWSTHFFVTKLVDSKKSRSLRILTLLISFVSIITIYGGQVVAGVVPRIVRGEVQGFDIQRGDLYPLYIIFLVATIITVLLNLYQHYVHARGHLHSQLSMVGIGVAGMAIVGVVLAVILPIATGSSATSEYVFLAGLVAVAGFMLAIIRHGLFDVRLAVVRSVAYLLSLSALAAMYYLAAYFISTTIFRGQAGTNFSVNFLDIFLALGLAFIFQPVKRFFDRVTNKVFYRDVYDTGDFLIRLGRILTSTTELHVVLEQIGKEVRSTLKASGSLFLVYRDHHPNELVGEGISKQFSDAEFLTFKDITTASKGDLLVVDKLSSSKSSHYQKLYTLLAKKHVAFVLPLISADETIGYFILGEKMTGVYTRQDTNALKAIANELVIAVQNARSVQAIRDLNANLEQRVNSATRELRQSNKKLIELDETKDEFVSMASHQLRTPLTSVKGYISMVLEGDAGKITPAQKRLLEEAFTSSERMVHLISDFLNISRLQTGKFVIDKSLVNLADLVDQEVDGLKATAEARALKLKYRKPSYFPSIYIDEGKIRQVLMNFIDNAIYYSMERTAITVKLRVEDGDAVLEVHDTGIGVPVSEQQRLFTKFFRATNARRQRPDGTGIGLFLAKKVIVAHGGNMVFSSIEGEGSVFGFRLPIKKLSEAPNARAELSEK